MARDAKTLKKPCFCHGYVTAAGAKTQKRHGYGHVFVVAKATDAETSKLAPAASKLVPRWAEMTPTWDPEEVPKRFQSCPKDSSSTSFSGSGEAQAESVDGMTG